MTWNLASPADNEKLRNIPSTIRNGWNAIEQGGVPYDSLQLQEQAADPVNIANTGFLYTKDDGGGDTELFYEDAAGTVVQMTDNSVVTVAANGSTVLPGGLILQWFTSSCPPGNQNHTFPTAFPNDIYNITYTPSLSSSGNNDVDVYTMIGFTTGTGFRTRNSTGQTFTLHVQAIGR